LLTNATRREEEGVGWKRGSEGSEWGVREEGEHCVPEEGRELRLKP